MSQCYRCNGYGHFARECHASRRIPRRSHHASRHRASVMIPVIPAPQGAPCTKEITKEIKEDFYFLLDVSGSMDGRRLRDAKETATDLFDRMHEDDRISIVTFDTEAFFKLKPRTVGQIRRQNELPHTLSRIYARGGTAIWDAIHMSLVQMKNRSIKTTMIVLTDGDDNSSTHSYAEVMDLVKGFPNVKLSIIHVTGDGRVESEEYKTLVEAMGGQYKTIREDQVKQTILCVFELYYPIKVHIK